MFYHDVKPHISPSAYQLWRTRKSEFVARYFEGKKTFVTRQMEAGKNIHSLIEGGFISLPTCEKKEKTIIKKIGKYTLLAIPDAHKNGAFYEYKTGKSNKWNEEVVHSDHKVRATALAVQGKGPVECSLFWVETQDNEGEIVATGHVEEIRVTFSTQDLKETKEDVLAAIEEVNIAYDAGCPFAEEEVAEYERLLREKQEIEDKLHGMHEEFEARMEFMGTERVSLPFGTFFFTERKKYEYPEAIQAILADAQKKKKEWEKTALPIIQKTLTFRKNG